MLDPSQGKEASNIPSLSVGLTEEIRERLKAILPLLRNTDLPYDLDRLMELPAELPSVILCGPPPESVALPEVAQMLRMQNQETPIYLIMSAQSKFDRKLLLKNGITDVFFLPLDQDVMTRSLSELVAKRRNQGKLYRPVKLVDFKPGVPLDFDTYIYLPVNNKHIKLSNAGASMDAGRAEHLLNHKVTSLFVSQDEMPKFYDYTAQVLKDLGQDPAISATERAEKLQAAVRELISGLFSDAATGTDCGKKVVEDCQNIVKRYVTSGKGGNWYARIQATLGSGSDSYSHAANVSAYAALFGIGLGLESVEELALAGLLHDIGLASVPCEIQAKPTEQWTREERALYEQHPEHAVSMVKERKLIVSELVHKIILQHHEKFNGTGYPKKLRGNRICPEAQVLAVADQFDELTTVAPGKPRMSPIEAIRFLQSAASDDPGNSAVDPFLMKRILALFPV